jgi:ATP-dependent exoDNAse (exonuclease V) alpha subunit
LKDAGLLADFGYAMTVHKAQGSEYKSVYLLYEKPRKVDSDGFRKWLYTAITRAEKKLTILY